MAETLFGSAVTVCHEDRVDGEVQEPIKLVIGNGVQSLCHGYRAKAAAIAGVNEVELLFPASDQRLANEA
tara:strand:- start:680 stop:889 length:210 start_codon:yes stop_codon:yes gene_type:complete